MTRKIPTDDKATETDSPVVNPTTAARTTQLVEHFFRHETGRLHGALVRMLGVHNLALAEDVAQEALLRAMHSWAIGGIPANPSAWVTSVAMNLARDTMRHRKMSLAKQPSIILDWEHRFPEMVVGEGEVEIRDDALRLMFVCCHPELSADAQVILALKVLCGFSTGEIAHAFLSSEAAIEKQLTRTKQRIRESGIEFEIPPTHEMGVRLDGVLSALYLLFNEGYKASAGDQLLREDLCKEAIRLLSLLVDHPAGNVPAAHALLALMLLTSARFPTRLDEQGALMRLDDQDRTKWDQQLIERGLMHLGAAAAGKEITEYHLQAGIAAIHCLASDYASTDWTRIVRHYDELQKLKRSPIVGLNRAVALAQLAGAEAGLAAIAELVDGDRLESHYLLHAVRGELHWRLQNHAAASESFRRALQLAHVGPEQIFLARLMERSSGNLPSAVPAFKPSKN